MSTWIKEIREKNRKTVTSPISGRDYIIRKITQSEIWQAGFTPIIPPSTEGKKPLSDVEALAWLAQQKDVLTASYMKAGVSLGCAVPTVVYGDENEVPEGAVHARWIAEDERWLYLEVITFSGIADEQAKKELETYLKNENGSESSTKSEEGMVTSQAS